MKTVTLDDDVYRHLLANAEEIGESASSILRRLLRIPNASSSASSLRLSVSSQTVQKVDPVSNGNGTIDPNVVALRAFLASGEMLAARSALDRFLKILGFLHSRHPRDFQGVERIRGRHRLYFGRSFEELDKSGSSVFPQQIPGSKFWVMTNSPNRQKRQILIDALRVLGYPDSIGRDVAASIE